MSWSHPRRFLGGSEIALEEKRRRVQGGDEQQGNGLESGKRGEPGNGEGGSVRDKVGVEPRHQVGLGKTAAPSLCVLGGPLNTVTQRDGGASQRPGHSPGNKEGLGSRLGE